MKEEEGKEGQEGGEVEREAEEAPAWAGRLCSLITPSVKPKDPVTRKGEVC